MKEFRARLDQVFAKDLAEGATVSIIGDTTELTLKSPATFDVISLREPIELGQRMRAYWILYRSLEGEWRWLCEGHAVGNRKLERLASPVTATALRVVSKWLKMPTYLSEVSLYLSAGSA